MNTKKLLSAVLFCALFATTAMSQTQPKSKKAAPATVAQQITPDTLGDLKAEFEYQEKQLAPYLKLHSDAIDKKMACVRKIFDDPLVHIGCRSEDREIALIGQMAEPTATKYNAAKDAYEREQRKADRSR